MSATIESIQAESAGPPADLWYGFTGGRWQDHVDVHDFIQANVTPFTGDATFLADPTERTRALWAQVTGMFPQEQARGILRRGCSHPLVDHRPRSRVHRP